MNLLYELTVSILQHHRAAQEMPVIFTVPDYRTDLQQVLAMELEGPRRPLLKPRKAGGAV